ncbi:MAG: ATP-dependent Clp protease ATP-binding subunit ClpC [Solirubrobacteraceae bacterium]|jgi:ATP-dependent Clp protease ATP-binding subunit ClpC|nr:ATP-dependent Clp protease ATP-binding subunit ClpC [Solirubrobacteraceae bacterium]
MFERFSEPARQAVVRAQEEARELGHDHIGAEHLLLGLLHEQAAPAAQVLGSLGVTLGAARAAVGRAVGPGSVGAAETVAFTPGARQALERAPEEASAGGSDEIGTEHILLGLLAEEAGVAVGILAELGAAPAALRAALLRLAEGGGMSEADGGGFAPGVATPPTFAAWLGAALTQAAAEATADGRAIEVTDFLVAMSHDAQSPAGWVLAELGVDGAGLRATAEHLRLLDREIARVGREMHDAAAAEELGRAGELRDQRRQLIAQRQRKASPEGEDG